MYEVLNTFKWKPNPKFQWKLIGFEKPQNFSKTLKPRFQSMRCMNEKGLEAYQVKKNLKNLRNPWGTKLEWDESVFGRETEKYGERYRRKWEPDRTGYLYRTSSKSQQMQVSRVIEVSVKEVLRKCSSTAEVSRNNTSESRTKARSIHQVSRSYRVYRPNLDRSTRYRGAGEIMIRKSLESSIDS